MSPADHLALAARIIGRALDVMEADPDNASRALERLRDHLCVWAASAKVVELELASKQAELEDSQLELEELEAEMTALLPENETGGDPAGPGDLAPVDPAELVGVTVEELPPLIVEELAEGDSDSRRADQAADRANRDRADG